MPAPSPAFIAWWFAPWRIGGPALPASCGSELARRDAYRHWCTAAAVSPDLPAHADWRWQAAYDADAGVLQYAGALFGGLLAARHQRQEELAALAPPARHWCLAVALTQPLVDWSGAAHERGMAEFALRAERAVPGLWPRLALSLPAADRPQLASTARTLSERDTRCALMCLAHARAAGAA